ncbi:glycosyltransferase [Patulibacter defluvii]|uniref:glycosyltransferase n=1 Tax=Patulibacter defluvii TaxID=3095358 RepID=UPI002A750C7D|nr:glycosyltransferase family 2 protein [Patulibacter sp. DM4]
MAHPLRLAAAALLAVRLARAARPAVRLTAPPMDADEEPPSGRPTVTVIVPARDEEQRIGGCLDGLAGDPWIDELLVVDDRSSDRTAEVAAAHGARVVAGEEPPPGRVGKPWALEQGLRVARGQVVVALDADTRPRPGLVAGLVTELWRSGAGDARPLLLSASARFECRSAGERLLHPGFVATESYRYGPLDVRGHESPPGRATANGQVVCVRARALREAGGFALAAGHMTDDVALARALAGRGWRVARVDATALVDVRMYESAAETWAGWGRSITASDVTARGWLALDLLVLWVAQALPLWRIALGRGDRLDGLLLAARLGIAARLARAYQPRGPWFWLAPLADLPVVARFTASVVRPPRAWRGRRY